jgi:tRNA ligase
MAEPVPVVHPLSKPEDSELITQLLDLAQKKPKLVKSSIYPAPADKNVKVRSWKMDEHKYYIVPSPFPTLARGLFSTTLDGNKGHRIVVRGYDKFFNIGEVPWTNVCILNISSQF